MNEQLWRETREVPLRRKTFAVLRYLVEHSSQLVTKEELLAALWPKVRVTDVVVMGCIRDLRRALSDNRKTPQFIQTVHGRGYRWIAETRDWRLEASPYSTQVSSLKPQAS